MKTNQQTIAIVGVGSMGSAIIKGLVNTNQFNIIGENPDNPRVTKLGPVSYTHLTLPTN